MKSTFSHNISVQFRMRRWKPLCSSTNAILHNFLYRRSSFPENRQFHGVAASALFHRRPSLWWGSLTKNPVDFVSERTLASKYFIHATGASYAMHRDYYDILGVSETATREEIKKAFHADCVEDGYIDIRQLDASIRVSMMGCQCSGPELAKKYHPDANTNKSSAKRKFQEIREAYETLQDPEKRSQYDRMKEGNKTADDFKFSTGNSDGFSYNYRTHFSDSFQKVFSEIFENAAGFSGTDLEVELSLSFSEAAKGCTKHISIDADIPCDTCDGRGHPLNPNTKMCRFCQGTGKVTFPPFIETCSTCKGSGYVIKSLCRKCYGHGVVEGVKEITVTIPAGVDTGDTIRVAKAGNVRRGFQPGNLFIKLKVSEDPLFSRDGADIYVDSKISFTQAILGGEVEVPTLSGKVKVQIPKGVQHGQLLKLRGGKGLPRSGFFVDHGNQYVRFRINLPVDLNERQRSIIEEFAEEEISSENSMSSEENRWQHSFAQVLGLLLILLFVMKIL